MTQWKKLGLIYKPSGRLPWARSHAANPVAEYLDGDLFRIYFSTRDEHNRSSIGRIVIDIHDPGNILEEAQEPLLAPGDIGMFDDSGVSIGCIVPVGQATYLYYMGWSLSVTVPWKNELGLAISEDKGQTFRRCSRFPIIRLDELDPYTLSYPWIIKEDKRFRMWYGSNLQWGAQQSDMLHVIKYAESDDGVHWQRSGKVVIPPASQEEYALCKPCVLKNNHTYHMWFCSRGHRYRIQHAKSDDGINWQRLGRDRGIDVSDSGWDSDMIEYPCVFDHSGHRYLLYSGDGYGRQGFGLARLEG